LDKYKPDTSSKIIGQPVFELERFLDEFPKKRSCLLYGPVGIGKSLAVYTLARDFDLEIVELNASDFRNKNEIKRIIGTSSKQASLFGKKKLIVIDEIDGLSGVDRGSVTAIQTIAKESKFPVIMIGNDIWSSKLSSLRRSAKKIEFKALNQMSVENYLNVIAKKEGINIENNVIKRIAESSRGDLRAAVQDLETISHGKEWIKESNLKALGYRNKEQSIFQALKTIFKTKDVRSIKNILMDVNVSLEEFLLWLTENLPREYSGKELADAYDKISRAAVFLGRVRKSQNWRFLVYANLLSTVGVATAKEKETDDYTSYKRPSRFNMIWAMISKNKKKNELAKEFAKKCHCSIRKAYSYVDTLGNIK
jgi:replication factor C large subunit